MSTGPDEFLTLALNHGALRFGRFVLKSGRISPYFFDVGRLADGTALAQVGGHYADALRGSGVAYDALFGPAYKGIPIACATAIALSNAEGRCVPYCFDRKEVKDHGEGGLLVGASVNGKRVVIVDDVITAGTALRRAIDVIRGEGGVVAGVVVALDRQEIGSTGRTSVEEVESLCHGPVSCVATVADLLSLLTRRGERELADQLLQYRRELCVPEGKDTQ